MNRILILTCLVLTSVGNIDAQLKELQPGKTSYTITKPLTKPHNPNEGVFSSNEKYSISYEKLTLSTDALSKINKNIKGYYYSETGVPSVIRKTNLTNLKKANTFSNASQIFFEEAKDLMKIQPSETEFLTMNQWTDKFGTTHGKFIQTFKNIPIYGAEVLLHGNSTYIDFLNGLYYPTLDIVVATQPKIQSSEIQGMIINQLDHYHPELANKHEINLNVEIDQWTSKLIIYPYEKSFRLAWEVHVMPNMAENKVFIIDAHTGEQLLQYNNVCKFHNPAPPDGQAQAQANDLFGVTRNINTYSVDDVFYLIDGSKEMFSPFASSMPNNPVGVIWTIDAFNTAPQNDDFFYDHVKSIDNSWTPNPESVSAQYNANLTYEYFNNTHERESIDDGGTNIISFVNVAGENGGSMANAFWNGFAIYYGNGDNNLEAFGRALDVAGHEITHGIIQNTANLIYMNESGAINESMADIFGAMIDRDDWLLGEDLFKGNVTPGTAFRNLQDPHNGAQPGNFGAGWQPKHLNEKYLGSNDNGGVHINSGIVNHAYYLFATEVGKDIAELVYYRALTTYLTRSSQFEDLRFAVVQSAEDLFGVNVMNAAKDAFNMVGIGEASSPSDYQQDTELNPGQDIIVYADDQLDKLILIDGAGNFLANPLSDKDILSKPSVSDDGSEIVFIGQDKKMHYIFINWENLSFQQSILSEDPVWRNAVISKDGSRIAALTQNMDNVVAVYDFNLNVWNTFNLFNPTYTEGIGTGDVLYADALQFDFSGDYIVYDAKNQIQSSNANTLEYWDIGFLQIWNSDIDSWSLGQIIKLFPALTDGISIGNPSFSKNSPYILSFDLLDDDDFLVVGVNVETGDLGLIYDSDAPSYPNYSNDDSKLIFDAPFTGGTDVGIVTLDEDKINGDPETVTLFLQNSRWASFFSNGERNLSTSLQNIEFAKEELVLFPNPVSDELTINIPEDIEGSTIVLSIYDYSGKRLEHATIQKTAGSINLPTADFNTGIYLVQLKGKNKLFQNRFSKI